MKIYFGKERGSVSIKYYRIMKGIYSRVKTLLGKIKRKIYAPMLPINEDNKVYIHLGCGEINAPGFINVDTIPYSHVHYVQDIEDLSIFSNKYADLIYASHVLEHTSHRNSFKVLKEWYRVLKEEGRLRLSVPDFDKLIEVYSVEERDIQAIMCPLMGGQGYAYNFHKSVFNERYLTELLLSVGFKEVRKWNPEKVDFHTFDDWASRPIEIKGRKYPISLNIEAVK